MGNLVTTITADTQGFNKAVNDAKKMLKVFTAEESITAKTMRKVNDVTKEQVNAYKKVLSSMQKANDGTKNYKQTANALEKELQKLKLQWSNLSDTAKKSDFGKAMSESIKSTQKQLNQLRATTTNTKKDLEALGKGTTGLGTNFSSLTSQITRFAAPLAVAEGAFKVLKDSFLSSEVNIDKWQSALEGAQSVYLSFVNTIRTHDWSNFNPFQAWSMGQASYASADELDTFSGLNQLYVQKMMTKVAELQRRKQGGENVDKEIKSMITELDQYYQAKRTKTTQAIKDKLNRNTPGIDTNSYPYNERIDQLLSGQRGDLVWTKMYNQYSREDLNQVKKMYQDSINARKAEKEQMVREWQAIGGNRTIEEVQQYTKLYDRYDEEISRLESTLEFLDQNHNTTALFDFEGAVREAITSMSQLEAEMTSYEQTKKKLQKLLEKESKPTNKPTELKNMTPTQKQTELKPMAPLPPFESIQYYRDKIALLQKEIVKSTDNVTYSTIDAKIKEYEEKIRQIEGSTKVTTATYDPEKHLTAIQTEIDSVNNLASAWTNVASAMAQEDATFSQVLSAISSGISQTISSVIAMSKAIAQAKEIEALSSGTASAAKLPYPYNLAAIGSVVASILSTFASFASLAKFADGGIVGGSRYGGDTQIARVNSGEMILNGSQQKKLFSMLNGTITDRSQNNIQEVKFHIEGKDLVGALNTYNNRISRVR